MDRQSELFGLKESNKNKIQKLFEEMNRRRIKEMQGSYSHTTQNGKIFVLPPDNMPCFVPDKDKIAFMPNGTSSQVMPENMPNAVPPARRLPRRKE